MVGSLASIIKAQRHRRRREVLDHSELLGGGTGGSGYIGEYCRGIGNIDKGSGSGSSEVLGGGTEVYTREYRWGTGDIGGGERFGSSGWSREDELSRVRDIEANIVSEVKYWLFSQNERKVGERRLLFRLGVEMTSAGEGIVRLDMCP